MSDDNDRAHNDDKYKMWRIWFDMNARTNSKQSVTENKSGWRISFKQTYSVGNCPSGESSLALLYELLDAYQSVFLYS